jgi:hypothetical protein
MRTERRWVIITTTITPAMASPSALAALASQVQ